MTALFKSPKTLRATGGLGRRMPNKDGVSLLVMNGIAVSGGAQLGVLYKLISMADLVALKIDALYDTTNKVLVYKHISDAFLYNPDIELWIFICPQAVTSVPTTPDIMCDKSNLYVAKALSDAKIANANIKLLGVAFNPMTAYTPTITGGIDTTAALAKSKLAELLALVESDYRFINAVLEARSFGGTISTLINVETLGTLSAPRIRFVIAADPNTSAKMVEYNGYAAVGAELGMMSLAAISENYGNPIPKFNLTNVANNLFIKPGLSGNQPLPTDIVSLNSLNDKGYIFAMPIPGVDGIYFSDTRTCVIASDDYAYCENNRVIDKALMLVRSALLPLMTNARLRVDSDTGELTLSQKSSLEDAAENALKLLETDGDISGGISCIIPSGINVLAGADIGVNITFVPAAIGRLITITAGFTNPF